MGTRLNKIVIFSVAVLTLVAAAAAYVWFTDHRVGNFRIPAKLYVYPGTGASEVLSELLSDGSVKRPASLKRAFSSVISGGEIQPGYYVFAPSSSSYYAARALKFGWQTPVTMTLSGTIRTKEALARKISKGMMVDSLSVLNALRDNQFLSQYGFDTVSVFSMVIPDSYQMKWTASVEDIFARFKKEYDAFWTPENVAKAEKQGLTKEQVSILASIVKGETNYEPEMPSVAGVYLNRLRIGMPLQADPTVAFCFDYQPTRILNRHLQVESPYNTYRHPGLPPGPIAVPTKACLNAVLNPDPHDYLYFCANADMSGTHAFARTLPEHMRNARAFQAAVDRRNSSR